MSKIKEILAAGIVRDILFKNTKEAQKYYQILSNKKVNYDILEDYQREDGSIIVRIIQQYNNSPLIQIYKED